MISLVHVCLSHVCGVELCVLYLKGRARQLYGAGFRSLPSVAHADPSLLVRSVQHLSRKAAGQIVASAQVIHSS